MRTISKGSLIPVTDDVIKPDFSSAGLGGVDFCNVRRGSHTKLSTSDIGLGLTEAIRIPPMIVMADTAPLIAVKDFKTSTGWWSARSDLFIYAARD